MSEQTYYGIYIQGNTMCVRSVMSDSAIPCPPGSRFQDPTQVSGISCTGRWILYHCATWGAHNGILFSLVKKENSDTCYNRVNLEDIMLSEINHKDCIRKCDTFHDSTYMWYLVRLIETESRMVVPRGLGGGEVGN